jgi:hypothetical protein
LWKGTALAVPLGKNGFGKGTALAVPLGKNGLWKGTALAVPLGKNGLGEGHGFSRAEEALLDLSSRAGFSPRGICS